MNEYVWICVNMQDSMSVYPGVDVCVCLGRVFACECMQGLLSLHECTKVSVYLGVYTKASMLAYEWICESSLSVSVYLVVNVYLLRVILFAYELVYL